MSNVLLVRNLKVHFDLPEGRLHAVDGVSFRIPRGKTVALVGESGSGKSVVSQAIMSILPKVAGIADGEILFFDPEKRGAFVDIAKLAPSSPAMRALRGGRISIIFQEPMTSLSPLHTVGNQVSEAYHLHCRASRAEGLEATEETLRLVGFPDPKAAIHTYPFELSGGLRQRAMIAMALICRPALLIADEPTTALDVTIQAQILKLMRELQEELHMAILMITHDLGVVANMADEVVVMYHGKVMEHGLLQDIFPERRASLSQCAFARGAALQHEARRATGTDPRDPTSRRAADEGEAAMDRRGLGRRAAAQRPQPQQELSHTQALATRRARRGRDSRPSTMSASTCRVEDAWGWSVNPGAAKPPPARSSCGRSRPMVVKYCSTTGAAYSMF